MEIPHSVFTEYRKWHKNWDDLCDRCGLCCYAHSYSPAGDALVDFDDPCEYLDTQTHLCRIFEDRLKVNKYCGSVNLFRALFSPFLPPTCAYVRTFRTLLHKG
ncbi:MAG: hypothetical protein FWD72_00860 [Eggerthellaceae bacterium]|nr:hypothetical protein [Eggerthellaceae bacterium]